MKSSNGNFIFIPFQAYLNELSFSSREGEYKVGDYLPNAAVQTRFKILGISESIGPYANYGRLGAENAFDAFLNCFLPMQYQGQDFSLLGCVKSVGPSPLDAFDASGWVSELDDFIETILLVNVTADQIPVVIGGGHNNALPLMRWASKTKNTSSVINVDAHADCRETNRRHSGNSFSYAMAEKILTSYAVLGLHAYYLNSFMADFMADQNVFATFYEDYLTGERNLQNDFVKAMSADENIGLEIDMDCIQNMPSSAHSPSGWGLDQIRGLLLSVDPAKISYLHLTEAAPCNEMENRIVGKALSYLCMDFMKIKELH
jgi:formiminoglutamase